MLEDAKLSSGGSAAAMMVGVLQNPADDAYDASIENAIREDLQVYGNASGSASLQQFINAHSGNMQLA